MTMIKSGKSAYMEVIEMCPNFQKGICEVSGIEPERIQCADGKCCLGEEWEKCKVFIVQFFIFTGVALRKIA